MDVVFCEELGGANEKSWNGFYGWDVNGPLYEHFFKKWQSTKKVWKKYDLGIWQKNEKSMTPKFEK